MCGLAGIIRFNDRAVDSRELHALNSCIAHRGPDDEGLFAEGSVGLVHRRLSIVDTSINGHQPMISADGNFVLVFNGEIYNHSDLRKNLSSKGYPYRSTSDTETLLYAYAEYGEAVLPMLNGIFSFAIFDRRRQELFIARDQFGVKPLYYTFFNDTFVFSSEMKSFVFLEDFPRDIDYTALHAYIHFLWCPGYQTPFLHVHKLEPGHYLRLSTHRFTPDDVFDVTRRTVNYYDIPFTGIYSDRKEKELTFLLDYKLNRAIERQLMSDVPVGFFVSGGLDSSLVAAMAQKTLDNKGITAFTIDPGPGLQSEGFSDDLRHAKQLSRKLGFHLNVIPTKTDILHDFDKMIWHLDEPQADPAPLSVFQISNAARKQGIKVLLGGTAGDDLFSGYRRHQALYLNKWINKVPSVIRIALLQSSRNGRASNAYTRRLSKLLKNHDVSREKQMIGFFAWIDRNVNRSLFETGISSSLNVYDPSDFLDDALQKIPQELDPLNQLLYLEMKSFLPHHNLNYTDKMSMAAGVEARVPYLDKEVVDFSATIPPYLKMKGLTTKYILKKVAEKYLPKETIYRKKAGFGAPVRSWIINDMHEMITERLSPQRLRERGIFNSQSVTNLINDNRSGKIDASYTIWSLLAIESWMRQFADAKTPEYVP